MDPLAILAEVLRSDAFYSHLTVDDVARTHFPGFLVALKPDPNCFKSCSICYGPPRKAYHTVDIRGVKHGYRDKQGRFVSPAKFWQELGGRIRELSEITK